MRLFNYAPDFCFAGCRLEAIPPTPCLAAKDVFLYAAINAEFVVIGKIFDYEVINRTTEERRYRKALNIQTEKISGLSNIARFKIAVEEKLFWTPGPGH